MSELHATDFDPDRDATPGIARCTVHVTADPDPRAMARLVAALTRSTADLRVVAGGDSNATAA